MSHQPFQPVLLDLLHQAQSDQNAFFHQMPAAELAASGTPDFWSARDHVAHLTFWRQRLSLRLQAILEKQPQPPFDDFEQLNPVIFEQHRHRRWPDLLSESDAVYARLIELASRLTEEELTAFNRFDWMHEGAPLYSAFMGNCYEHTQQHLAQYALDRHDFERAREIYEAWASRVIEAEVA